MVKYDLYGELGLGKVMYRYASMVPGDGCVKTASIQTKLKWSVDN